jgi:hypothetical protein
MIKLFSLIFYLCPILADRSRGAGYAALNKKSTSLYLPNPRLRHNSKSKITMN